MAPPAAPGQRRPGRSARVTSHRAPPPLRLRWRGPAACSSPAPQPRSSILWSGGGQAAPALAPHTKVRGQRGDVAARQRSPCPRTLRQPPAAALPSRGCALPPSRRLQRGCAATPLLLVVSSTHEKQGETRGDPASPTRTPSSQGSASRPPCEGAASLSCCPGDPHRQVRHLRRPERRG